MSVWAAFLKISEAALQVAFKSEYLVLAGASSAAMNELLFTKEALAEVSGLDMNVNNRLVFDMFDHTGDVLLHSVVESVWIAVDQCLTLEAILHMFHDCTGKMENLLRSCWVFLISVVLLTCL